MAKIKLTKGELKNQRDQLKQFKRYLPTLQLKKQQLQSKILEIKKQLGNKDVQLEDMMTEIEKWCGVLADPGVDLSEWITPEKIVTSEINVAGANLPFLDEVIFKPADYDYYSTPFWVDEGIEELRKMMNLKAEVDILKKQIEILQHELRVTTQRVNLFEKIKIPECMDNIRQIRIYLGDQQANAVGVSKVAKKKVEVRNLEEVAA